MTMPAFDRLPSLSLGICVAVSSDMGQGVLMYDKSLF